jgi:outer membrane receptor protein involved in Fe transport
MASTITLAANHASAVGWPEAGGWWKNAARVVRGFFAINSRFKGEQMNHCAMSRRVLDSRFALLLAPLAMVLNFTPSARAQESTASVNGTIQDSSSAVVPDAAIALTNINNGVKQSTVSTGTGRYVFVGVPPGQYSLSVTKAGFAGATRSGITLVVNQTATLDFTLTVGNAAQSVVVEASAMEINTTTSNLGTAITTNMVQELPLNGRQFTQMLSLTPGAAPANVAQNSGGGQSNALGTVVIPSINGQQNRSNYFLLDGVNDTEVVFSSFTVSPVPDDIREFKVQSHNDEAQFGYVTGGTVNVVTKSGTNTYHGTLWEYMRNNALDARNPFSASNIELRQNQFGANIGGPVRIPHIYNGKDKTFIFGSYEGFRQVTGGGLTGLAITPTSAQLGGDLSGLSTALFNPFTTRSGPGGTPIRDPFAGNIIPASQIDPHMVAFAKAVFPAAGPTILGQYNTAATASVPKNQDQFNIRADEYLSSKDVMWFRYTSGNQTRVSNAGFQNLNDYGSTDGRNWGINYVHTFNPTTLVSVTFGHDELTNIDHTTVAGLNAAQLVQNIGFDPAFGCGYKKWGASAECGVPSMSISGFIGGGEGFGGGDPLTGVYQITGDFAKVWRNHTFKAGYDYQWQYFSSTSGGSSASFAAAQTADPANPGNTGSPLASFLLGVPDSANQRRTLATVSGQYAMGAYVQDQWKASSRLTFNIGLRYEFGAWPKYGKRSLGTDAIGELDMNNGSYILQVPLPPCSSAGAAPCIPSGAPAGHIVVSKNGRLWDNTNNNWAPRVGLAYRLNDKTSIRTSFGIFYDQLAGITQTVQGIGGDWPAQTQVLASNLNAASKGLPTVTAENPLAGQLAALPPDSPFTQVEWYRDPHQKNAYSEQWNFGVQRAVGSSMVVEANYVGSHSSRLTVGTFANTAVTPGPGNPADRAPYPYITPTYYDRSIGKSSYNSFQFKLEQRMSHGLQYLIAYTWSKSIDIGCSGYFSVEGCSVQTPYNLNNDRSVSGYDLPHVLSASLVYKVPAPRTGSRPLNYVVGNWQVSSILQATSGLPYDLGVSGDIANTGNSGCCSYGYERLNLVGNPGVSNPSPAEWFNKAAFAAPAAYTFGNLGRNSLRADRYINLDMSLVRDFPFGEQRRFQFRADLFNTANHPVWDIPVRDFSNPQFGQIFGTRSTQRQIQFAAKLFF